MPLHALKSLKIYVSADPDPVLPTDTKRSSSRTRLLFNRRVSRVLFAGLAIFALVAAGGNIVRLRRSDFAKILDQPQLPLPPLYEEYYLRETQLPQHDSNLAYPEGRTGKYIAMENIVISAYPRLSTPSVLCLNIVFRILVAGWGNSMQELLLDAHIAYRSGRSYVRSLFLPTLFFPIRLNHHWSSAFFLSFALTNR